MEEGQGKLVLVTGGVRSGKSAFAEAFASESKKNVFYIATAAGKDKEMRYRIAAHRRQRPDHFITLEEQYFPHRIIKEKESSSALFLLDCLTLLLSNHILSEVSENGSYEDCQRIAEKKILDYVELLAKVMRDSPSDVLVVTNEVGMSLVSESPLGRAFCDLSGRANQVVAKSADQVWLMVCGIAHRIK